MTDTDAEIAVVAAEAGAALVRTRFGEPVDRHAKQGVDFVTDTDLDAERAVFAVLAALRPEDARLGEESGLEGPEDASRRWLVDPLCGTLNFAARTPLFAVNVALVEGGVTRAGAVVDPMADETFWTDGAAAWVRRGGRAARLEPSPESRLVDVNLNVSGRGRPRALAPRLLADVGFAERYQARVTSTSLALIWVADGRRAAYVSDSRPVNSVHFAPGLAITAAAGCVVTALDGEPLGEGDGLLCAADAATHADLLELLAGVAQ